MRRGAGVPPAAAGAFLRSAQDRLCPRFSAKARKVQVTPVIAPATARSALFGFSVFTGLFLF